MPGQNALSIRLSGDASGFVTATNQANESVGRLDSRVQQFNRTSSTMGANFSVSKIGSGIRAIGGVAQGLSALSSETENTGNAFNDTIGKAQQFALVAGSFAGPKGAAIALAFVGIAEGVKLLGKHFGWGVDKAKEHAKAMAKAAAEAKVRAAPMEEFIGKLQREIDLYGASATQIALYEANLLGLNAAERERVMTMRATIDALDQKAVAEKEAAKARDERREREQKQVEERGERFKKAMEAQSGLFRQAGEFERPQPQIAGFGTQAAATAVFNAQQPRDQIKLAEDQLEVLREMEAALNEVNRNLGAPEQTIIVDF